MVQIVRHPNTDPTTTSVEVGGVPDASNGNGDQKPKSTARHTKVGRLIGAGVAILSLGVGVGARMTSGSESRVHATATNNNSPKRNPVPPRLGESAVSSTVPTTPESSTSIAPNVAVGEKAMTVVTRPNGEKINVPALGSPEDAKTFGQNVVANLQALLSLAPDSPDYDLLLGRFTNNNDVKDVIRNFNTNLTPQDIRDKYVDAQAVFSPRSNDEKVLYLETSANGNNYLQVTGLGVNVSTAKETGSQGNYSGPPPWDVTKLRFIYEHDVQGHNAVITGMEFGFAPRSTS